MNLAHALNIIRSHGQPSKDPDWEKTFILPDDVFVMLKDHVNPADVHSGKGYKFFNIGEYCVRSENTDPVNSVMAGLMEELLEKEKNAAH